jgi:hypothetical protein
VNTAPRLGADAVTAGVALAAAAELGFDIGIDADIDADSDTENFIEEIGVIVGVGETWAPECLSKAGGALLDTTSGVMDATGGSEAIATGKVDHPVPAGSLIPPSDRFEQLASDVYRIGPAGDLPGHLPVAARTNGHDASSFTSPVHPDVWL